MQRVALLNGATKNQDYDRSAIWVSLMDGWVYEGLALSNTGSNNRQVTAWKALIKVTRTTGQKILVHYENTATVTFTLAWPFKIWIAVTQANIDTPTLNAVDGSGIGAIAYGTNYPAGNYISLGEVDVSNTIVTGAIAITPLDDLVTYITNNITQGNTNFGDIFVDSITLPGGDVQDQIDSILSGGIPGESLVDIDTYMLGETVVKWDSLFVEDMTTFALATTAQSVGDVTADTRFAVAILWSWVSGNSMKIALRKVVSPSVDFNIRIESDSGWVPSWTLIDPNATASIAAAAVTASFVDTNFVFSGWTSSNVHSVTQNVNETSQTLYKWVKFTLTNQVSLISVTKVAACTATKAYLYDSIGTLMQSVAFSGNVATFNNTSLVNGQDYYILCGSDGLSYTSVKQTWASAYPYIASKLSYIEWGLRSAPGAIDNSWGVIGSTFHWSAVEWGAEVEALKTSYLYSVTKWYWGTTCSIKDPTTFAVLATAFFVGNVATFSTPFLMTAGQKYLITTGSSNSQGNYGATVWVNIEYTRGYRSDIWYHWPSWSGIHDITSIETREYFITNTDVNNIVSISSRDNILIPTWVRAHIVMYVGTYGTETVNGTNYYQVWFNAAMLTSIRLSKFWNGTVRGGATLWPDVTLSHWNPFVGPFSSTQPYGIRIVAVVDMVVKSVTKTGSVDATRCLIKTQTGNTILATATFSGNTATFTLPYFVGIWWSVRIELDSNGAAVSHTWTWLPTFPYTSSNANLVAGSQNGADQNNVINDIVSIVTNTGTTVNPYMTYCYSTIFEKKLLCKTDARYTYKLPKDTARIALDNAVYGLKVVCATFGMISWLSGLTQLVEYFISNVPGVISSIAGTNKYILWTAMSDTMLYLEKKEQYLWTITIANGTGWTPVTTVPAGTKKIIWNCYTYTSGSWGITDSWDVCMTKEKLSTSLKGIAGTTTQVSMSLTRDGASNITRSWTGWWDLHFYK